MKKIIPMLALSLFVLPTTIKADALNPIIQNDWQTETVNLFISDSINIMLFNSSLKLARMGLDMTHCDAADYLDKIYR